MTEKQEIYFDILSIRSDHIMVNKFIIQYSCIRLGKKEIFEPKSDFFVDKIVWIMWITSG